MEEKNIKESFMDDISKRSLCSPLVPRGTPSKGVKDNESVAFIITISLTLALLML